MTEIWVWHIFAGFLGVLFSVSIFYQKLEKAFGVYKPLKLEEVVEVVQETGEELSSVDLGRYAACYNRLAFIGRSDLRAADFSTCTMVRLQSGERLEIVQGERFFFVRRTKQSGKQVCFRLYEKEPDRRLQGQERQAGKDASL